MSIFEMLAERSQEQPFCGITIGIVTDIKDPDKKNRVKVRLLNRTDSVQETDFIRVMTPMSGKQYGAFFLPEVGDEVLVGFVDGDFTDPYVLGSLWNTKSPAPVTVQDGKNELRVIQSKTNHKLEFNDGTEKPFASRWDAYQFCQISFQICPGNTAPFSPPLCSPAGGIP